MCNGSHLGYDFCQNRLNLHDVKILKVWTFKKNHLNSSMKFFESLTFPLTHSDSQRQILYDTKQISEKFPVDNIYLQSVSCIQDVIHIIYPLYITFYVKQMSLIFNSPTLYIKKK